MKLARTMCILALAVLMLTVSTGLVSAATPGWGWHRVMTDEDYITYSNVSHMNVISHYYDGYMYWYCPDNTASVYYRRDWSTTPDTKLVRFFDASGQKIWENNYIP